MLPGAAIFTFKKVVLTGVRPNLKSQVSPKGPPKGPGLKQLHR